MKKQTIILLSVLLQLTPGQVDVNNIEIPEEKLDDTDSESGGNKNHFFLSAQLFLHHLFILIILYKKFNCFAFLPLILVIFPGGDFAPISGVAGFSVGLQCDISPALAEDQLLLILWYKIGLPSPVYT